MVSTQTTLWAWYMSRIAGIGHTKSAMTNLAALASANSRILLACLNRPDSEKSQSLYCSRMASALSQMTPVPNCFTSSRDSVVLPDPGNPMIKIR